MYSVEVEVLEENGDKNYVQLEIRDEKWGGLQVQNLKNVHSVTFIWHQPDGRIYRVEERALDVPDYVGVVSADVWFWINFCEINSEFSEGVWCIEAFMDGRRCAMDYFLVRRQLLKKPFRFELAI